MMPELHDASDDLIREMARPGPRYTSYPTAPVWTDSVGAAEYAQHLQRRAALCVGDDNAASIYVHIPFCRRSCRYCGCNVVVTDRSEFVERYVSYVCREMSLFSAVVGSRMPVSQVHWGGGTPTTLTAAQMTRLWQTLTQHTSLADGADISIEVDPRVTTYDQLAVLREFGFSRISLGVQDFNAHVQRAIGRDQTYEETVSLYENARALGFGPINFDLVYGLPEQRQGDLEETIKRAVAMRPDRMAVFGYAHVPWMRPNQREIDEHSLPSAVQKLRMFEFVRDRLLDAGYVQIGMDHFSLPDDALALARDNGQLHRNFQGYTTRPNGDTVAFGITAISDVDGLYAQNAKKIGTYYECIDDGRFPVERGWVLSAEDRLRRYVIHGLMCNFVIDVAQAATAFGFDKDHLAASLQRLDWADEQQLIERDGTTVRVTRLGQLFLRNIAMAFDAYLPAQQSKPTFSSTV